MCTRPPRKRISGSDEALHTVEILTGEDSTIVELERKRTATTVLIAAEEALQSKLQEKLDEDDGQVAKQFKESEARRKELESKVAQLEKEISDAKSEADAKRKEPRREGLVNTNISIVALCVSGCKHLPSPALKCRRKLTVDSSKGDELAAHIESNYQEFGVYYVIWEQRYLMD